MAFQYSASCRKGASQLFITVHPQEPKQEISPSDSTCSLDNICALCPHNAVILFQLTNSGYTNSEVF